MREGEQGLNDRQDNAGPGLAARPAPAVAAAAGHSPQLERVALPLARLRPDEHERDATCIMEHVH